MEGLSDMSFDPCDIVRNTEKYKGIVRLLHAEHEKLLNDILNLQSLDYAAFKSQADTVETKMKHYLKTW